MRNEEKEGRINTPIRMKTTRLEDRIKGKEGSPQSSKTKEKKAQNSGRFMGTPKGKGGGVQLGIKRFLALHRQEKSSTQTKPLYGA